MIQIDIHTLEDIVGVFSNLNIDADAIELIRIAECVTEFEEIMTERDDTVAFNDRNPKDWDKRDLSTIVASDRLHNNCRVIDVNDDLPHKDLKLVIQQI